MGFKGISDILNLLRRQYPALGQRVVEAESLSKWDAAVGPLISKHTRAIRVEDNVLWVEVTHPAWRSELHHRKRQILEKIGAPIVDLKFVDPRN